MVDQGSGGLGALAFLMAGSSALLVSASLLASTEGPAAPVAIPGGGGGIEAADIAALAPCDMLAASVAAYWGSAPMDSAISSLATRPRV